ncbi:hypothetical protein ACIQI8_27225 [Streptomyces sp. NPDC092369]|uniref:hypothetical protein n=1 Tax=Streptomyces sp. NPDC092369 TaxID=3366015 RepID=UPI0038221E2D
MSASVTVHCNRQWADGACAHRLYTDAVTLDEARSVARWLGWRTHPGGLDYCPTHSGNPTPGPAADVVQLHAHATADGGSAPTPLEVLTSAAQRLRALATAVDEDIADNPYWHSQHTAREDWFANGITNAVGGPAGVLAGLLSPANARLFAQALEDRRPRTAIPAELFLISRNIQRSANR